MAKGLITWNLELGIRTQKASHSRSSTEVEKVDDDDCFKSLSAARFPSLAATASMWVLAALCMLATSTAAIDVKALDGTVTVTLTDAGCVPPPARTAIRHAPPPPTPLATKLTPLVHSMHDAHTL
jgi:hypothetical protein